MANSAQMAGGKYGPIEVFRAGTFSPMGAPPQTITEANLRDIAATYDRTLAPAPVVIGHPSLDAPAFGWVEHLYVEGGILKATLEDTVSEFSELVKAGRYKRVSVALYMPKASNNPKPGAMYLKHVGFLGATAPAVPGLKPVKFSDDAGEAIHLVQDNPRVAAFANPDSEIAKLRRQLREQEVEKLIGQGRVLPVFKDEVVAFASSLDDSETVSFSEGNTATRKDWFMSYLARQPQVVSFGAMDLGPDPMSDHATRSPHNIPDGYRVDRKNEDVFFAAQDISRQKGISFAEAVDIVLEGRG